MMRRMTLALVATLGCASSRGAGASAPVASRPLSSSDAVPVAALAALAPASLREQAMHAYARARSLDPARGDAWFNAARLCDDHPSGRPSRCVVRLYDEFLRRAGSRRTPAVEHAERVVRTLSSVTRLEAVGTLPSPDPLPDAEEFAFRRLCCNFGREASGDGAR